MTATGGSRRSDPPWGCLAGLVVAAVLAAGAVVALTLRQDGAEGFRLRADDSGAEADYRFVIPPGAGAEIAAGRPLDLLPGTMDVEVGEMIEIVNQDDQGHLIGPFFVGADETLRQVFASPGVFEGVCSVHSSGEIVITVR